MCVSTKCPVGHPQIIEEDFEDINQYYAAQEKGDLPQIL